MSSECARAIQHNSGSQLSGDRPFAWRASLISSKARRSISLAAVNDEPLTLLVAIDETSRGLEATVPPAGKETRTVTGSGFGVWAKVSGMIVRKARSKNAGKSSGASFGPGRIFESVGEEPACSIASRKGRKVAVKKET